MALNNQYSLRSYTVVVKVLGWKLNLYISLTESLGQLNVIAEQQAKELTALKVAINSLCGSVKCVISSISRLRGML